MTCPKCSEKLKQKKKDLSYNAKHKAYTRIIYVCEKDDIWITVEIPKTKKL